MITKSIHLKVLDYIYDNPGCTTTDIAKALRVNYSIVKRIVDDAYSELHLAKSSGDNTSSNTDAWRWYTLGM